MVRASRSLAVAAAALAASPAFAQTVTGPSSSATPYITPVAPGVVVQSILTAGDQVGTKPDGSPYRMVGIPDGLGYVPNGNGTVDLFMNHELGQTSGVARAHGAPGAFVSRYNITTAAGPNFLRVNAGRDHNPNPTSIVTATPAGVFTPPGTTTYGRFCSGDLPAASAFQSGAAGTPNRMFLNGEEVGPEGRAFAHVVTGPATGTSYELPRLGKFSWENAIANPLAQAKTIVAGTDDSSVEGQVYFYVGTKTATGSDVDRAGLTNGSLYGLRVAGTPQEDRANALNAPAAAGPRTTGRFDLYDHGDVSATTGAALNTSDVANGVTSFLRPEDGAWDPVNARDFFFCTTDRYDQVKDGVGTTVGRTRLWRTRFDDINNPQAGGTIEALLDGTEAVQMMDNMTVIAGVDGRSRILIQEDVGGVAHNGKIWLYDPTTDQLQLVAQHDRARFGDIGVNPTGPFSNDEESSGIVDASDVLGPGWVFLDVQAHGSVAGGTAPGGEVVEYGQLLAMFVPQAVPEPGTAGAVGLVAAVGLLRRRRARH